MVDFISTKFKKRLIEPVTMLNSEKAKTNSLVSALKGLPRWLRQCRNAGLILGSGRSPGGANGNPLQYSCLRNPMDRGAWQATVHRVIKSQTWLKRLSTHLKRMDNHNTGMPQLPESIHSGSSLSGHVWNWEKYGELESLGCQSEHMQSLG